MADFAYQLFFDDEPAEDELYADVLELLIDEHSADASTVSLKLATTLDDDGEWTHLGDDRWALFASVRISLGYESGEGIAGALGGALGGGNDGLVPLFSGYVSNVHLRLGSSPGQTTLALSLVDMSVLMGLEEKVKVWSDVTDSDVIDQICGDYADRTDVESTATTHEETEYVLVQRGTDFQFARMLARRNGFELAFTNDVDSGDVVATCKPPQLDRSPQSDLAIQFGDESNLLSFGVRIDGRRPLSAKVTQTDIRSKAAGSAQVSRLSVVKGGVDDLGALATSNIDAQVSPADATSQLLLLGSPSSDATEMEAFAQAARDEAGWFMTAEGEINCDAYGSILRAWQPVLVKGAGDLYSGAYYVTRVTHKITSAGQYTQSFEAKRNARGLDGSEQFGGDGLGLSLPGF